MPDETTAGTNLVPTARYASRTYAWYVVFVLFLCQVLAAIDSNLPSILVEDLKSDLDLSDSQIGLLTGPAFAMTYAIAAIPIARLADARSRVTVIGAAIIVWSACTAVGGVAKSFGLLLLTRAGVAIGEAGLTPSAHSMISDYHSEASRSSVMGVYHLGLPIGTFAALALGGYLGDQLGWRSTFFLIGASGLVVAALVFFTVREPVRREGPSGISLPKGSLRALLGDPVIRNIILGGTLFGLSTSGLGNWAPAYIMRSFNLTATEAGASFGAALGIAGTVGILGGGILGEILTKRGPHYVLSALAIALFITIFTQVGALLLDSYAAFLGLMAATVLLSSLYLAPTYASVQSLVDASGRAFASAVTLFAVGGIGMGLGALVAGVLSDLLRPGLGDESLRWALILTAGFKFGAVYHYWRAGRHLKARTSQFAAALDRGP
jgi:predicted MFS family arabinose efflux permease